MCSSSELSISSSIPVIFPARLGCIAWIRGNKRSPEGGKGVQVGEFGSLKHQGMKNDG